MVRAADQSLYVGISTDVDRRFAEHCAQGAKCAKYLRGRSPLSLVFRHGVDSHGAALKFERQLKRLSKVQKERLATGQVSLEQIL